MAKINHGSIDKRLFKGKSDGESNGEAAFGYIDCDLVAEDKARLKSLVESGDLYADLVDALVVDLYDYGVKADTKSQGYKATLTDRNPGTVFCNKQLVARGSTPANARNALLYKHLYKLSGDWSNATARGEVDFS